MRGTVLIQQSLVKKNMITTLFFYVFKDTDNFERFARPAEGASFAFYSRLTPHHD
jgi:hypothetical protein